MDRFLPQYFKNLIKNFLRPPCTKKSISSRIDNVIVSFFSRLVEKLSMYFFYELKFGKTVNYMVNQDTHYIIDYLFINSFIKNQDPVKFVCYRNRKIYLLLT